MAHPNYAVSSYGRVKRLTEYQNTTHAGKILKPQLMSDGSLAVRLDRKNCKIHRLVAVAFIPNSENKREVNHLNGVRTENDIGNLGWVTPAENCRHAYRTGLISIPHLVGESHPNTKLTTEAVRKILKTKTAFGCVQQLAREFHVSPHTIRSIRGRHNWGHVQVTQIGVNPHGMTTLPFQGSKHPNAKLTEAKVRIIRASSLANISLAKQFCVTTSTIGMIRRRETWTHI